MAAGKGRRWGQAMYKLGRAGKQASGRRSGEVAAGRGRWWRPTTAEVVRQKEMEELGEGGEAWRGWEEGGAARRRPRHRPQGGGRGPWWQRWLGARAVLGGRKKNGGEEEEERKGEIR
jgi:hypothetical protein